MTAAASSAGIFELLLAQLAAFQAVLLLASGLHKFIRRERTRAVMHEFAGVPRSLAPFALWAAVSIEVLAAGMLWTQSHRVAGGMLAVFIWGGYLSLILHAIVRGRRDVDCGCTFGTARRPLGAYQATRNTVLVAMALLVSLGSLPFAADPVAGPQMAGSQILAACALLALYGALDQAMAITPLRAGELA